MGERMMRVRVARTEAFWQQRAWQYAAMYVLLSAIVLLHVAMVKVTGLEDYLDHLAGSARACHYQS
jgi:hypothetical protein